MALRFYETQPLHCPHCGKGVNVTLERNSPTEIPMPRATRYRCHGCEREVSTWVSGLIVRTESLGSRG